VQSILVLCLGNEVLSDDRFGAEIAELLRGDDFGPDVELLFVSAAGFALVDLLANRRSVLIVDTILTGTSEPGSIHYFPMGNLTPSKNLVNSHQINLPTALEFGRKMGYAMPDDIQVLAVEAQDVTTLSERLTEPVAAALDETTLRIRSWIEQKRKGVTSMTESRPLPDPHGPAKPCPECQGRGWKDNRCLTPDMANKCSACDGKGFTGSGAECRACRGTGLIETRTVDKNPCALCGGAGLYPVPESMTLQEYAFRPGKK